MRFTRIACILLFSLTTAMGGTCTSLALPVLPGGSIGDPIGGGPIGGGPIGGGPVADSGLTVTVINSTDYDIDPMIEYEDIDGVGYFLDLGVVYPGEVVPTDFFCDEVIYLTSTNAEQYVGGDTYVLDPLPYFEQDYDFYCGEEVTFEFVGDDIDFDVYVDADGYVLY